jgi:hypothetical protein
MGATLDPKPRADQWEVAKNPRRRNSRGAPVRQESRQIVNVQRCGERQRLYGAPRIDRRIRWQLLQM